MTDEFKINLGELRKSQQKRDRKEDVSKSDHIGDVLGFVDRSIKAKPGRKKSPRTGQVHAKVLPPIDSEISREAIRRGVVQGVIIEEAWILYKEKYNII